MVSFKKAINAQLKRTGVTRYKLSRAVAARMPASTVYKICDGDGNTSIGNLEAIFEALGLTIAPGRNHEKPEKNNKRQRAQV